MTFKAAHSNTIFLFDICKYKCGQSLRNMLPSCGLELASPDLYVVCTRRTKRRSMGIFRKQLPFTKSGSNDNNNTVTQSSEPRAFRVPVPADTELCSLNLIYICHNLPYEQRTCALHYKDETVSVNSRNVTIV